MLQNLYARLGVIEIGENREASWRNFHKQFKVSFGKVWLGPGNHAEEPKVHSNQAQLLEVAKYTEYSASMQV